MSIIFYSRRCRTCANLFKLLENEKLLNGFKLFCVDDRENKSKIPPGIKVVPTMIVPGINKPLGPKESFQFIQNYKFMQQKSSINTQNKFNQPVGYRNIEMGSISDSFSYTDDQKNNAFSQSYFSIGDEAKNAIITAPENEKINKHKQSRLMDKLKSSRSDQDKNFEMIMKESQLNAIINSENK